MRKKAKRKAARRQPSHVAYPSTFSTTLSGPAGRLTATEVAPPNTGTERLRTELLSQHERLNITRERVMSVTAALYGVHQPPNDGSVAPMPTDVLSLVACVSSSLNALEHAVSVLIDGKN